MDTFYKVAPVPMFLLDIKGTLLASVGWSDICTRFHRVHPKTSRNCVVSDTQYSSGVPAGEYKIYKCKNNMWSAATPIIAGGKHVGNLFSGQFFFTDEEPDRELFRAQANRHVFPEQDYLAALDRAPRMSRTFVASAMEFYLKLAQNISQASWNNICLARSVTEVKSRETELRRVNRILRARSRSDQAMVRATDEQEFLDEACKIMVEDCGHAMAWIGFAEQDEGKTVRPAACAGGRKEDIAALKITWADMEHSCGPMGTAIRTGKPSICRDLLTAREQALAGRYASCAALPLQANDKTFGAISIYSKEAEAFTDQEVHLLSGLADDLCYGIGALRMRLARKQAEARFQQAQKMEAVGLMAGGIAHDFNNILASIVGYNSLLLGGLKGNRLRKFSLEIKRSAEMAATLTQQLLGVSGNRGAQRRVLEPNSVIMAMAKMLRRLVGEKIRLDLKLHRSAWPVKMDSGQLEQIVMNLAVNARDAMPKGGRLTLATKNLSLKSRPQATMTALTDRYFVLEVRDNGSGMDAAVKARIFEPFFTTKGPGRGTGLGLSTVKSIVDEYHGHVTVESEPERGAVFRVLLPSVRGGANEKASGGHIKKSHRGHETILVVEDNGSLLTVIKMTLQRAGYTVFCARTAEEAVSQCGKIKRNIDLLLTDVVLPDMDGPELATRVKELWPGMRTVYMSGYPGNALGPITGFGGCVLLEKPFSFEQLLSTLREVLAKAQGDLF